VDTKRVKEAQVTFLRHSFHITRLDHQRNTDTRKKHQVFELLLMKLKTTKRIGLGTHTEWSNKQYQIRYWGIDNGTIRYWTSEETKWEQLHIGLDGLGEGIQIELCCWKLCTELNPYIVRHIAWNMASLSVCLCIWKNWSESCYW
jgi:hypothetical protein